MYRNLTNTLGQIQKAAFVAKRVWRSGIPWAVFVLGVVLAALALFFFPLTHAVFAVISITFSCIFVFWLALRRAWRLGQVVLARSPSRSLFVVWVRPARISLPSFPTSFFRPPCTTSC